MVAGGGLEPSDLRVMSPTSYQLLYPAVMDCKDTQFSEFPNFLIRFGDGALQVADNQHSLNITLSKRNGNNWDVLKMRMLQGTIAEHPHCFREREGGLLSGFQVLEVYGFCLDF